MGVTGILGGRFDPPHNGHVALARAAAEALELERLVVVVALHPGHKDAVLDGETRLELARLAFPAYDVVGDGHPRTVDLLRDGPWRDPLLLVGADEFCDFLEWKEPEEVLRLAQLGVATRPGYPRERLDAVLAQLPHPERVLFFELESLPVSSSGIRARIGAGEPIDDLVPPVLAAEIERRGLYRP